MKQRIYEILKELMEIRKQTDLTITDIVLFQESCSIYRGEKAGENKWGVSNQNKAKKVQPTPLTTNPGASGEPTEKQILFLNKHEVTIPETKAEATQIIKTYIDNQNAI